MKLIFILSLKDQILVTFPVWSDILPGLGRVGNYDCSIFSRWLKHPNKREKLIESSCVSVMSNRRLHLLPCQWFGALLKENYKIKHSGPKKRSCGDIPSFLGSPMGRCQWTLTYFTGHRPWALVLALIIIPGQGAINTGFNMDNSTYFADFFGIFYGSSFSSVFAIKGLLN